MVTTAVTHDELLKRWDRIIKKDPETYNQDFLRGRYQNEYLKQYIDYRKQQDTQNGISPGIEEQIQYANEFNTKLYKWPGIPEPLSVADMLKIKFSKEHEGWKNAIDVEEPLQETDELGENFDPIEIPEAENLPIWEKIQIPKAV